METINGHIQVYTVWVNGRDIDDVNQHFPVNCNIENYGNWHCNIKQAVNDYYDVEVYDIEGDEGLYSDIYQDIHIALYSIDINVKDFESKFDLNFDLDDVNTQEMIPYYVDYDFNVVAERIDIFK